MSRCFICHHPGTIGDFKLVGRKDTENRSHVSHDDWNNSGRNRHLFSFPFLSSLACLSHMSRKLDSDHINVIFGSVERKSTTLSRIVLVTWEYSAKVLSQPERLYSPSSCNRYFGWSIVPGSTWAFGTKMILTFSSLSFSIVGNGASKILLSPFLYCSYWPGFFSSSSQIATD